MSNSHKEYTCYGFTYEFTDQEQRVPRSHQFGRQCRPSRLMPPFDSEHLQSL